MIGAKENSSAERFENDESTIEGLYCLYADSLCAFLESVLSNLEDAKDITQDVFLKLYELIDRYDPKVGSFKTWLFTIGKNAAIDFMKRNRRIELIDDTVIDRIADPLDRLNFKIEDFEDVLEPTEYKIIFLRYKSGYNVDDVAKILNSPISSIKRTSLRAFDKIKELLSELNLN